MSSYSNWMQYYYYDSLNRLYWVNENNASSQVMWQQAFTYDRWGNRTIDQGNTSSIFPKPVFTVDPNTNRLYAPSDPSHAVIDYDAAGNQKTDYLTWNGTRTYDAENRMITANNGAADSYTYDGNGKRVRRRIGTQETWQVYGFDGELVAEYAPNAPVTTPDKEYGYRNGQLLLTAAAVDLALNKPATQSSTFYIMTANLAVDGNTSGDFWGAMSSATADYGYQDWWQVDLGNSQSIGSIQVWPRTDCCPEHTANFYVFVSDNPFTSTDLTATQQQSGVSSYWVTGNNATAATVNVNRTGRYVRVQRNDSQYLVLAEVKVFAATADLEWLVTDHLGTPRMIADAGGSLAAIKRHDYLPFGEELFAGTGGRTQPQGYSVNDGIRQKFTRKERDIETTLDYFGARYYSSTQGRFTSVDPENAGASLFQPQSWNGYAYSLNNPPRFIDPDGLRWAQIVVDGGIAYQWFDDNEKDDNGQTAYGRALASGYSAVTFPDESKSFSYTNGVFAPGETLTTVTLSPDGPAASSISTHVVTWGEWTKYLYLHSFADAAFGTHSEIDQLKDFVSSLVGTNTNISLDVPNLPGVPGAAIGSFGDPNISIEKQLAGKGQLRDLRSNPNFKGVDIDALIKKTPPEVIEMVKKGTLSEKIVKIIKKAFELRDLSGRGKTK